MLSASTIGPSHEKWGQTFTRGRLFAILELPFSTDASETGHQIIEQLQTRYLESPPETLAETEDLFSEI